MLDTSAFLFDLFVALQLYALEAFSLVFLLLCDCAASQTFTNLGLIQLAHPRVDLAVPICPV